VPKSNFAVAKEEDEEENEENNSKNEKNDNYRISNIA